MNKNYWLLLQGQFVSTIGTSVFFFMMILYGQEKMGSASLVGIALMLSQLPGAIIGPFVSGVIDKYPKKKILVITDLLSGFCILLFSSSFYFLKDSIYISYLMIFTVMIIGIFNSILGPTVYAISKEIVDDESIQKSNSYLQASSQAAGIIAHGIGGVLYTLFGPFYLTVANGVSYILSGISELFIEVQPLVEMEEVPSSSILNDSIEGFKFIWNNKGLRSFIGISFIINLALAPIVVLLPFHIKTTLGLSSSILGYAMSAEGAGMMLGFFISSKVNYKNLPKSLMLLFLTCSGVLALLGLSTNAIGVISCCLVLGMLIGLVNVPLMTLLQQLPPKKLLGRVMSVFINSISIITPIGIGLTGVLIDYLQGNTKVLFFGCSSLLILSSVLIVSSKSVGLLLNREN